MLSCVAVTGCLDVNDASIDNRSLQYFHFTCRGNV